MVTNNPMNVYSGSNAVLDYINPDRAPPTPLVELPASLNPYASSGVRIYAKMHSAHPLANVKAFPALNMLQRAQEDGVVDGNTKEIVEYSSGSTVMSLGIIARLMGISSTQAYLSNKTSAAKLDLLRFFGLELTLHAGPSQPLPADVHGGIYKASERGGQPGSFNPDQYANLDNPGAHKRWSAKQILAQLPDVHIFCAGMGTSGTMTGTGSALKESKPSIVNVGVCTQAGDRVPGPRALSMLQPVTWYPWRETVDTIEECGSKESYSLSLQLSRHGLLAGPSSGFNLQGLFNFLERAQEKGELDALRGEDGQVNCVFMCCDLPFIYINEYKAKLKEAFPPLHNAELLDVDLYPYLDAHELYPVDASAKLRDASSSPITVLDIRTRADFRSAHLPNAVNLDIANSGEPNPYSHAPTMARQWRALNAAPVLDQLAQGKKKTVVCVCYDGSSSRAATSILRHRGVEAFCVRGGFEGWVKEEGMETVSEVTVGKEGASAVQRPGVSRRRSWKSVLGEKIRTAARASVALFGPQRFE